MTNLRGLSTMLVILALSACSGDGKDSSTSATDADTDSDTDTDSDSDTDTDTDTDSDTDTDTPGTECEDWSLDRTQEFTWEDLFGADPLDLLPNEQGPGVALGDLDNDGDLDAILAVGRGQSIGFRNEAGELIRDDGMTVDGGAPPHANSVALADLDGDGDVDGVLARGLDFEDVILWNNGDATFTSETLPGSDGERISPALGDLDGDGRLDIFVAGFENFLDAAEVQAGTARGDGSSLYFQTAPGVFNDRSHEFPPGYVDALTYHGAFIDYDDDFDLDLYIANDFGNLITPNAMLENVGGGILVADDDCGCALASTAMGTSVGDLDNDLRPDLFITDWGFNYLLLNDGAGGFLQAQQVYDVDPDDKESEVGWGSQIADLNLDGYDDVAIAYGPVLPDQNPDITSVTQGDAVMLGDGSGNLADVSAEVGFTHDGIGRSVAIGDLDRDGRPDIVVAGRVYLLVYLSQGGCPNGITLTLEDGTGNAHGIGASVEVDVGDHTYRRWLLPSGSFGQSATELYLGLGNETAADAVRITWPDGTSSELSDVPSGTHHEIK